MASAHKAFPASLCWGYTGVSELPGVKLGPPHIATPLETAFSPSAQGWRILNPGASNATQDAPEFHPLPQAGFLFHFQNPGESAGHDKV